MRARLWLTVFATWGLAGGCLLDWDRDGLRKGEDCDDLDAAAGGPSDWYQDEDEDGYGSALQSVSACLWPVGWVANGGDCADDRPNWNPGVAETWYDGDDVNCDGLNDYDADQDGYVYKGYAQHAGGSAPDISDCEDNNPSINPGVAEVWYDGVDQDCDGGSDYDADRDFEDAEAFGGSDCDDDDPGIRSGRSEDCSNGVDDNCDGVFDDQAWPDGDGDGYGDPAAEPIEACRPPAGHADNDRDCDDDDPLTSPAAAEVCGNGVDDNCQGGDRACGADMDTPLFEADARLAGDAGDSAGLALIPAGDHDGDGDGELLVGGSGAVWLIDAPRGAADLDEVALARVSMSATQAGNTLAAGDYDGDGYLDVLAGDAAPFGSAWLFTGPLEGALARGDAALLLESTGDSDLSESLAAGDLDGDGRAEFFAGAPARGEGGILFLLPAALSGTVDTFEIGDRIVGADGMRLGATAAVIPDLDGDGLDEVAAGDTLIDGGGVYLFSGPIAGEVNVEDADIRFWAEESGDGAGRSVCGAGDVDGDGGEDLLIGATGVDTGATGGGAAYLITDHGSNGFSLLLAEAQGAKIVGEERDLSLGSALTRAGDLDDDGFADVLLGAPKLSDGLHEGAAVVLRGPLAGVLTLDRADALYYGDDGEGEAGFAVAAIDLDGDGAPEVATSDFRALDGAGEVYLLFGVP